jgi:hypothetical protein
VEPTKEAHGLEADGGLHFQLNYVVYIYCNMFFGHVVLVHPAGRVLSVEMPEQFHILYLFHNKFLL